MAELWLVCEGEPGSVDVALLQRVFAEVLAAEIVVEPACGSNPSPVASFIEKRRGGKAAFVRDRDYHPRARAEASFTDGRPEFFWRRHSIENYLLPPPIILQAFQNLREQFEHQRSGRVPPWIAALPASPEEVNDALRECARRRAAEETCRLANRRLWDTLPPEAKRVQKRDPVAPSLNVPADWREALCREAERVREAAVRLTDCENLRHEVISSLFDEIYSKVTADDYVKEMEFLIDFHGRDLLKAFQQWLGTRGAPPFYERLCRELISATVRQYSANRGIHGSDDFRDLANGVRSLAELERLAFA